MTSSTLPTAFSTPLPPYRALSPSRSSTASCAPVDAPLGTIAVPTAPDARNTSTATVGSPRESSTSRPRIISIVASDIRNGLHPWQSLPFDELECGAPAGRHMRHLPRKAELLQRLHRFPAPDHRDGRAVGHRPGDGLGAVGVGGLLEEAHRAVPEDRLRVGDMCRELAFGLLPDVEDLVPLGRPA